MKKKQLLLFGLIFLLLGCHTEKAVQLTFSAKKEYAGFIIKNDKLKVPIQITGDSLMNTGAVYFETSSGKTWLKGKPVEISNTPDHFNAKWDLEGRSVTVTIAMDSDKYQFSFSALPDSGILKWGMNIAAKDNEYFTGLFERTVDGNQTESWKKGIKAAMNLRGQSVDMFIKPTLSLYCPFYISSNGYGLFVDGTWPGHYDLCKTDTNRVSVEFEGPSLSGIIYTADNPADLVKANSLHVGPTIVPPRWAFLPWRWRDNHTNLPTYYDKTPVHAPFNSMVVEDMLMMKAFDIPCGVYWIDRPWAKGFRGYEDFEWDTIRLPHPDKMIEWLHSNNTRFLLWLAPWVAGNMRETAIRNGYNEPLKGPHGSIDSSNVALLDFTNPEACKWWQENGIEKMLKQGVDGFKLDRSEEIVPESRKIILHNGKTAREAHNEYPVLYVKTVNESCKKIKGDDFVLIPRAGYTGSSKYSGFWGGDIASQPEGLRAAIIALQRNAIIGNPVWGSDIGGYWGGNLDREVCARWLAFGCFSPVMEFGPTEDRAPWDMDSVPHYDSELIAVWRLYAKIHTELADYTFKLAQQANKTGMPIVRPLFLEYPDQEKAWSEWQTYMYGPDILVAPIWQKGIDSRTCYLPEGTKWRDAWDSTKVYNGGQIVSIQTPLYKIPVFIREGSDIDLGDLNELYNESFAIADNKPDLTKLEKEINY